jgi:hypothetical protein
MPKKILGMGYQQRFKVNRFFRYSLIFTTPRLISFSNHLLLSSIAGLLCTALHLGSILCTCLFCWAANDCFETAKVCPVLYFRVYHVHGKFWNFEGTLGALVEHVHSRSNVFYDYLFRIHVFDLVSHIYQRGGQGLCIGNGSVGSSVDIPLVVFD